MPVVEEKKDEALPEVVVVGSINYDQFVYVSEFPKEGETIYGTSFETGFGGKGDNFTTKHISFADGPGPIIVGAE